MRLTREDDDDPFLLINSLVNKLRLCGLEQLIMNFNYIYKSIINSNLLL